MCVRRTRLLRLPHLLAPHQHCLLPHLFLTRLRIQLPRSRILELGTRLRERCKHHGC